MPEATIEAPAASPLPQPSGMSRFFEDVTRAANTPEDAPPKDEPKTESHPAEAKPKSDTKPEAKPQDKATEKKPEAKPDTKPADKAPPTKTDGASELRKRLDEVSKSEKTLKAERDSLMREKEELSKKRFWSEDDQKRFDELSKETADLRRQIAESAYEKSDEFKKQYVAPYTSRLQNSIENAKKYFQVSVDDDGGTRAATDADWWKVASASVGERAAIAQRIFGVNAANVIADIRRLEEIKESADEAIKQHREGYEAREKQTREQEQQQQGQYNQFREMSRKQLAEQYGDYFGDTPEDQELTDAWRKGQEFADMAAERAAKMTMEERAAYAEVARARRAWFDRGNLENKRLKAKVSDWEAELAKYRGSDPGAEKEKGKVGDIKKDEGGRGIEALARRFDEIGG